MLAPIRPSPFIPSCMADSVICTSFRWLTGQPGEVIWSPTFTATAVPGRCGAGFRNRCACFRQQGPQEYAVALRAQTHKSAAGATPGGRTVAEVVAELPGQVEHLPFRW